MKRNRFSEERVITILKEAEAGAKAREVCQKNGITEQTFYRWRSQFRKMDVSEARRLKVRLSRSATEFRDANTPFPLHQAPIPTRRDRHPRASRAGRGL